MLNTWNLQNIPSSSSHGKKIKECFISPPGWILVGADFEALESKVNALLTRDPNQLKVFTDGYDGHSLRAYSYYTEQMPEIQLAPNNQRCFKINNQYVPAGTIIRKNGIEMPIENYYDSLK